MAYTLTISIALGSSKTGLTLNAQLINTAGGNVGGAVATGFVEVGAGNYQWTYASFPDGHRGGVKFYDNADPTTILAFAAINPEEGEYTDQKSSTIESDVWGYASRTLTQTAASVTATVSGSTITITTATSLAATLTGLGNISARTKLYFTVKADKTSADTDALIKIEETAGLQIINGATATTAANGDITVNNAVTGSITIVLAAAETANLARKFGLYYDVKMVTASAVTVLTSGQCNVDLPVTRAIT
jgi:hypothetical protein